MKKILLFLLVALLLGSQSMFGQEIDHEKIITESFTKVIKGALWSKRPEAKEVYEGRTPPGVDEVITLETDYFVLFAAGEHNNLDINYIFFPKGQKIYKKNNDYFAAYCGNRIVSWRPIEKEKIVEKIIEKESLSLADNNKKNTLVDYGGVVKTEKTPVVNPSVLALGKTKKSKADRTWVGRNLAWLIPTAAVLVAGSGLLLVKALKKGSAPHGTMSGGRPYTESTGTTTTQDPAGRGN